MNSPSSLKLLASLKLSQNPRLLDKYGTIPTDLADLIAQGFRIFSLQEGLNGQECKVLYRHLIRNGIALSRIDFRYLHFPERDMKCFLHQRIQADKINGRRGKRRKVSSDFVNVKKTLKEFHCTRLDSDKLKLDVAHLLSDYNLTKLTFGGSKNRVIRKNSPPIEEAMKCMLNSSAATLKYLDLTSQAIPDEFDLARMENLETLILSKVTIRIKHLKSVRQLCELKILDLGGVTIDGFRIPPTRCFRAIVDLSKLKYLNLKDQEIPDELDFAKLEYLETLVLENALFFNNHVQSICQLKRLEVLDLSGRRRLDFWDSYLEQLIRALPNLAWLDLSERRIPQIRYGAVLFGGYQLNSVLSSRSNRYLNYEGVMQIDEHTRLLADSIATKTAGPKSGAGWRSIGQGRWEYEFEGITAMHFARNSSTNSDPPEYSMQEFFQVIKSTSIGELLHDLRWDLKRQFFHSVKLQDLDLKVGIL